MNTEPGMALRPDPWLGQMLGKPAWRLTHTGRELDVIPTPQESPCFVDARIPATDVETVGRLQSAGFRLIDTTIQLERSVWPIARSRTSRYATPDDRARVASIAENNFTFSRFHLDPQISKSVADKIKREWASNYFNGSRGDHMVVAEVGGEVAGFTQFLQQGELLIIDLVAVDARFRGKGLARDMIAFAESKFEGIEQLRVGTQAANSRSLHAYISNKFQYVNASYVFHHHG